MNVVVQLFNVLLVAAYGTGIAAALVYLQVKGLGLQCLIVVIAGVVVGELDGRNVIFTLMTRHSQELPRHAAFQTVAGQLRGIVLLGIILIEVLREVHYRLLDELHVTGSSHRETQGHRVVGLHLVLVESGLDVILPYSTRETCGTIRQRQHLDGDAGSLDLLLHLHIAGTAIEEGFKGIDIMVTLHHHTLKGKGRNLQLTRHLREHHILAPCHRTIGTAVNILNGKLLLLGQRNLLRVEALKVRHLTLERGQVHQRIDLIGQQNGLLLVNTALVGTDLDKEVAA